MATAARTIHKPTSVRIPNGLSIRRRGEAIETVKTKMVEFRLLSSQPDSEVVEVVLKADARLALTPAGSTTETLYVVSGQLSCPSSLGESSILEDDCIITQDLREPTILTALVETCLIYVTTKPQFHTISENMTQLRHLAVEVELKDGYTSDHCDRLQTLSYETGRELGLPPSRLLLLDLGAYLHDVGKIHVPISILNKPDKLTQGEWAVIKQHPTYGRELLDNTFMKEAGKIVEQHHERIDGGGYPYGLACENVLIEASIVAVADTYDAMTTDRPYRKALPQDIALAEIRKYAGIHYPKEVVRAFISALARIESGFQKP